MSWLWLLVADFLPRSLEFDPRQVHVGIVMREMALRQDSVAVGLPRFFLYRYLYQCPILVYLSPTLY